jgi:glycosyltransferase involved in cell wall biosynthesis
MATQVASNGTPFVSVVLPTFDRGRLIARALESVADQTYRNVEVVVVDDGSTDETREVVERFARERVIPVAYFWQENRGCAAARNQGLRHARGQLLAFLDSDDAWLAKALESLVTALIGSQADFAYSPAIEVLPDGSERVNYPVAAGRPRSFAIEHFKHTNVRNGAVLLCKHVLARVHGFDERLTHNEDSDFIQRVAVHYRATYCDEPTVKHYHHGENKSHNRVAICGALIKSAERVLEENPAFRRQLGEAADQRLRELKAKHVEALLVAGRFLEAGNVVAVSSERLPWVVQLAARTRSTMPMKARDRLRGLRRLVKRRLRHGLRRGVE